MLAPPKIISITLYTYTDHTSYIHRERAPGCVRLPGGGLELLCSRLEIAIFSGMTKPDTPPTASAKIVPIVPKANATEKQRRADRQWSKDVMARGYTIIPTVLLHGQERVGLNPNHLNVILQIISHWWTAEDLPYPGKALIARRMGRHPRQVQHYLTELEQAGLIARVTRKGANGGQTSNGYRLTGLVAKLKPIAAEFAKAAAENKARRESVERRGGTKLRAKSGGASPA